MTTKEAKKVEAFLDGKSRTERLSESINILDFDRIPYDRQGWAVSVNYTRKGWTGFVTVLSLAEAIREFGERSRGKPASARLARQDQAEAEARR